MLVIGVFYTGCSSCLNISISLQELPKIPLKFMFKGIKTGFILF